MGVSINLRNESDGLLAIFHQVQVNVQVMSGDRFFDQEYVSLIVLNQYDAGCRLSSGY